MNPATKKPTPKSSDAKSHLTVLRMTTTIGALSLTLAGWGMLARADAVSGASEVPVAAAGFSGSAASLLETAPMVAPVVAAVAPTAQPTAQPTATAAASVRSTQRGLAAQASVSRSRDVAVAPTSTAVAAALLPTAMPTTEPTATPAKKVTLNVVKWVKTQAGDPVAIVKDNRGTQWYVWGPDVDRIEQGLEPEYQPQPVNAVSRSRGS